MLVSTLKKILKNEDYINAKKKNFKKFVNLNETNIKKINKY